MGVREHLTARNGWIALGVGVTAFELACPKGETLSEGMDRLMDRHKAAKIGGAVLGLITTAHLTNTFEQFGIENLDPFHRALLWKD